MRLWNLLGPTKISRIEKNAKVLKIGSFGCFGRFGGTKNGTSGARIKIPRPLLETQTTPKIPI